MKEKIILVLLGLSTLVLAYLIGKFSSYDNALHTVVIGGFIAALTAISIEYFRAEREEKFRREDRAMAVAKSMSKSLFQIQNANYAASISGELTDDLNKIAMDALGDLEESRAAAIMFLGDKAGDVIAGMTPLLSKVVEEIHEKRGQDFDIKDCSSFPDFVDKHTEMMEMLKNYAEGNK